MMYFLMIILIVLGTIGAYLIGKWIYVRTKVSFLLPILSAAIIIIAVLLLFNISYETYMTGGKWIERLLGPAVVALAYPLYQNRHIVKKLAFPIVSGTLIGAIVGLSSGIYLARILGVEDIVIYSLAPKSVTTPVAMEVAESLGGEASIAAVFVMIAGIGGAMLSPYVFGLFKINTPIGRGIGLGSASHAIGTAKALEQSEMAGSISTVAMILSAIFVSILAPLLI